MLRKVENDHQNAHINVITCKTILIQTTLSFEANYKRLE